MPQRSSSFGELQVHVHTCTAQCVPASTDVELYEILGSGASGMAQQERALAANQPRGPMVERKNQFPQVVLWPLFIHCGLYTHTQSINVKNKQKQQAEHRVLYKIPVDVTVLERRTHSLEFDLWAAEFISCQACSRCMSPFTGKQHVESSLCVRCWEWSPGPAAC